MERYYACPRCGARGEAKLVAIGRSMWGGASILSVLMGLILLRRVKLGPTNAQDQAGAHAQRDAERVLSLMRCPMCNKRPHLALVWPVARVIGNALVGAGLVAVIRFAIGFALGRDVVPLWFGAAVFGGMAVAGELSRFRRVRDVEVVKMEALGHGRHPSSSG